MLLKKITLPWNLVAVAGLGLGLVSSSFAASARLDIDLANPGHEIPPAFYGLMTEEINHSYDGGLLAELIQNRTFQDPGPVRDGAPIHWSIVGSGKVSLVTNEPVNGALPISLRLELAGKTAGIANDGYWGIPVRPNTTYTASLYAKARSGFSGSVLASLVTDADTNTVVEAESQPLGVGWKKYTVRLKTPENAPTTAKGRFVLTATGQGSIDFSLVSLFPPTYRDTPNGLRPDLMNLLAEMHPAFIRLPGGNYVEGGNFKDRFDWKKMIGPPDQRPGHMGCWSYRSSDAFGLPEYLLWCQQLGAEPVLALFAGYTLNGDHVNAGSPELGIYTKEALEEIEYVMGPATSEWGSRRAADGFPEPFPLRCVEIGNEDGFDRSRSYEGRFTQIAKAIRAKYPQLTIIATMPVKGFTPDLIDDHLYADARQMISQFNHYDPSAQFVGDRNAEGIKTFVGEWATQGGAPTPNMGSAIADAVYVMGLERNSDHVVMQCYAPLLTNVNPEDRGRGYPRGWQWATCLIGYDALNSFGSPSYHVLAMFGQNRGDVILPARFDVPPLLPPGDEIPRGLTGIGTYETQVEYKDFSVTGSDGVPLAANLINETNRWSFPNAEWITENGVMRPIRQNQSWALAGDPNWKDYTLRLKARKLGGREGFLVLWHAKDGDNYRWWNIGGWGNTASQCEMAEDGGRMAYGPSSPFTVETGRWYDIRLEVKGNRMRGFIDNKLIVTATDEEFPHQLEGYASASYARAAGEVILKVVNTSGEFLETQIDLRGPKKVGSNGRAIVLAGEPSAVNTSRNPTNVVPKVEPLTNVAASFSHTFPPHSVSLLRFPAN